MNGRSKQLSGRLALQRRLKCRNEIIMRASAQKGHISREKRAVKVEHTRAVPPAVERSWRARAIQVAEPAAQAIDPADQDLAISRPAEMVEA